MPNPGLYRLKKRDRGEYIFHYPNVDPQTLSKAVPIDETNNLDRSPTVVLGVSSSGQSSPLKYLNPMNLQTVERSRQRAFKNVRKS